MRGTWKWQTPRNPIVYNEVQIDLHRVVRPGLDCFVLVRCHPRSVPGNREIIPLRNPLTPQPGDPAQSPPTAEDSFLDLLVEILEGVDASVRGSFLRSFFRTIAQIDLTDAQAIDYWEKVLHRGRELSESLGRRVSLKTALVDVLASTSLLRLPILVEYEDFKKLQINAATDALTGLYNRRLFDEYCDKELNRAKRYAQQLAVVILDLHKLKEVNDQRGHLQGDDVLQLAAATLRKTLRASDFSFRIGGDEFALLLPQTDPEQAITLCNRIRSQYELDLGPIQLDIGVTLDFGVAVHPVDGDQKSVLMNLADQRLYQMKISGRAKSGAGQPETFPPSQTVSPRQEILGAAAAPEAARAGVLGQPPQSTPTPISSKTSQTGAAPTREHRKWERVSLAGTKAYAILIDSAQKTASVADLSYGGVALIMDNPEEIPVQFNAVLHVPILPPVRVVLRKSYTQRMDDGRSRVGCSFIS
jgi:diguanylate cyclase (GGDEF)-like protein